VLISSRVLKNLVAGLPADAEGVAARIRGAGFRVEEVTPLAELLQSVVVGHVVAVDPHPNADRLRICRVDVGGDEPLQIVTGAANVRAGGRYPVIRSGTTLPNGTRIRKGRLRGEVSEGMLGSADELELGDEHDGLLELEGAPAPGTPLPAVVPVQGFVLRVSGVDDPAELVAAITPPHAAVELQIDLFADVACPWCYIGEQRLATALRSFPGARVIWRWRPYQLQPNLPAAGVPWAEFVTQKFGADAASALAQVKTIGRDAGLDLRFEEISRAPNTADAHRLILLAEEQALGKDAAAALFEEYFTRGGDITDPEVLVRIAAGIGLSAGAVREHLASDRGRAEVRESQEIAGRLGISGVPFYIFNGRVAISGAQEPETMVRALEMSLEAPAT
jgi:predicted DsbA family dithiol-disulfide isomerase/tRNA-binding EMAP/Myf-like protein